MLETFCASANFKSLLLQHDDMPVVNKFLPILDQATKDRSRDPLAGAMSSQFDKQVAPLETCPRRQPRCTALSKRALDALESMYRELFSISLPKAITHHSKCVLGKVSITTRVESNRDCNVFFRSTS